MASIVLKVTPSLTAVPRAKITAFATGLLVAVIIVPVTLDEWHTAFEKMHKGEVVKSVLKPS